MRGGGAEHGVRHDPSPPREPWHRLRTTCPLAALRVSMRRPACSVLLHPRSIFAHATSILRAPSALRPLDRMQHRRRFGEAPRSCRGSSAGLHACDSCGSRTPSFRMVFRIATCRLDDWCHCRRASAHRPEFHPPGCSCLREAGVASLWPRASTFLRWSSPSRTSWPG